MAEWERELDTCEDCGQRSETTRPSGMVENGHYESADLCAECRDRVGAWVELDF